MPLGRAQAEASGHCGNTSLMLVTVVGVRRCGVEGGCAATTRRNEKSGEGRLWRLIRWLMRKGRMEAGGRVEVSNLVRTSKDGWSRQSRPDNCFRNLRVRAKPDRPLPIANAPQVRCGCSKLYRSKCLQTPVSSPDAAMATKYAFTQGLRELRFHLCSSGQGSEAARYGLAPPPPPGALRMSLTECLRSFLRRAYPIMKHHNPSTPILIREATGVEPKVWARYGMLEMLP